MPLLSSADFFQNKRFHEKYFRKLFQKIISKSEYVSKGLDPDQDRQNVGPELGPNCLRRLYISR